MTFDCGHAHHPSSISISPANLRKLHYLYRPLLQLASQSGFTSEVAAIIRSHAFYPNARTSPRLTPSSIEPSLNDFVCVAQVYISTGEEAWQVEACDGFNEFCTL